MNKSIVYGGAAPKPPGFKAFLDQSMEGENERPCPSGTALHTSVTLSALGSLPSVALSSARVWPKYRPYFYFTRIILLTRDLQVVANGNSNCRQREKIIVVDHRLQL